MQFDNLTEENAKQCLREIFHALSINDMNGAKSVFTQITLNEDIGITAIPNQSPNDLRQFDQKFKYLCKKEKAVAGFVYLSFDENNDIRTFVGGVGNVPRMLTESLRLLKENHDHYVREEKKLNG